jgi:outer membrane protein assembly factor BamB
VRAPAAGSGLLGSPSFMPTPERPIGWRGDGTGRYPGATPPTAWSRSRGGGGQGILYAAPLPDWGVSSPIIVGERIFLTCEPDDLVCLDKKTGKTLWIRSNPAFEGLSEEERKADPAIAEQLVPLSAPLAKLNLAAAEVLAAGGNAARLGPKHDLQKKIHDLQQTIDKKLFGYNWGQAVFGFAGCTPTSDGKRVYAFFTNGSSACYDLDGTRKWIVHGGGDGAEHGNFASPLLLGGQFVVWANQMRAYDAETGKLKWSKDIKGQNTYGSLFRIQVGEELVACFQSGYFVRIKDGQSIWGDHTFSDNVATPIVEGRALFAGMGDDGGVKSFLIPASAAGGKLTSIATFKADWGGDEISGKFQRSCCASPLYVDGLLYRFTEGGGLLVNDAATGEGIYHKVLPMKSKTEYWNWGGASACPTLAGKYIYLIDNQGVTIIIQPGKEYKEIAKNVLEEPKADDPHEQSLANPVFEGSRLYYRVASTLYCIGDK